MVFTVINWSELSVRVGLHRQYLERAERARLVFTVIAWSELSVRVCRIVLEGHVTWSCDYFRIRLFNDFQQG
jgi:hypothetical protein